MGMDFSGFIKSYLYKFNNELKESLKDKSIIEKNIFRKDYISIFVKIYFNNSFRKTIKFFLLFCKYFFTYK